MHGNVWEWVVDWFAPHPKAEQLVDPSGPPEGKHRVFKGGGWYHEAKFARIHLAIHDGAGYGHQLCGISCGLGRDALTVRFLVLGGELREGTAEGSPFFSIF